MNKIINLHFKIFLLFLVIIPIWPYTKLVSASIMSILIMLGILFLFNKDRLKKKIDIIDIMFILLPLFYLLPYILGASVNSLIDKFYFIFMELGFSLTFISIRRYWDKEKKKSILISLVTVSIIYFFISFIYQVFPRLLISLRIISYFGDTYLNSIDRFYGNLDYCNSSALFFSICFFISFFNIKDDIYNKCFYYFATFINMLGFLITYSKMVTIDFVLVSIVLIIYLMIRKKKELLDNFIMIVTALIIPIIISIKASRLFLINLNLFIFFIIILFSFVLYLIIIKGLEFCYFKFKFSIYILLFIEIMGIVYFTLNPILSPLRINNVMTKNDYIISDFILKNKQKYNIEVDVEFNKKSNVSILLCGLYIDEERMPTEEVIVSFSESDKIKYILDADDKYEYYYVKLKNLDSNTDFIIDEIRINGKKYAFNSLIIPYQFIHQLDLLKYDKESVTSRFTYYKDSLKMLNDYGFVFGHGYDSFVELKEKYNTKYVEVNPHSLFFQLWLDTGLYGVIYFILIVLIGIWDMYRFRQCDKKIIYFILFSLCMIVMPFDLIYSTGYMKFLLMLFFVLLTDNIENNDCKMS